jgi:hypothetical protein
MSQATTTTDHDEIRRWAEERGGRPSVVRTGRGRGGILRFDFGEDDEKLEETSWEEFFRVFEDSRLALLHQDTLEGGETSRFFKFVAHGASSGAGRPRKAPSKRGTTLQRAPGKAAAKRSATKGASKRASSAASKGSARPKRASKAGSTARGGAKASARGASKAGTKDTARKSGTAAKKSGTASRTSRSAASSAGLKGATKRTRSGGRASKKPSR